MRPALTASQQLLYLRRSPIAPGSGDVQQGRLTWRFCARPSPLGREYGICIDQPLEGSPSVLVEDPNLLLLTGDRRLPHVYGDAPVELCLYHPTRVEWQPWMRLDETVVPWTYLWLYYFEHWLVDGEWLGGGEHPDRESVAGMGRRALRRTAGRAPSLAPAPGGSRGGALVGVQQRW